MTIYLDTSVIVGFVFGEAGWQEAADVIAGHRARWVSDFGWGEFIDTLARKVRTGAQSVDAGRATARGLKRFFSAWSCAATEAADVTDATKLIEDDFRRSLKLPDAIHLAIARRVEATLLTFDRRQATAAIAYGLPCIVPARLI